ncbi:hypothetical protein [Brevundimonas sp.]|uniref:hypothetical protein n=1 Tax=Brevundimonas sp. TaxID=1871086 RepID=UPI0027315D15|nr:hypothetical protein [Brevundimonas sp.]MDP1913607.1 hypothetical protein [Brevundimonas sp.]
MKYRLLFAAAAAALTIPATTAAAQSWSDILGAVVQAQANSGYNNQYGDYRDPYRRVSQGQAIRIARSQGVQVRSAVQRGNGYDLVGRDSNGARVTLRVDARTGQIVRFDRQSDYRRDDRWDRDDRRHDHDRRDHHRDRDGDDDDDDDD